MLNRFPQIDPISFWIGAGIATLFWWIMGAMRPIFQQVGMKLREKRKASRQRGISNIEEHYRQAVLQKSQGMHLAASLFSLDEIIIPPLLLAPPVRVEPGISLFDDDIAVISVPYLPAWPELSAVYRVPTLTLAEGLSGKADIVLTGKAGSGKTVTLAYLASSLARGEAVEGLAADILPVLIHAADLNIAVSSEKDVLEIITELLVETSVLTDSTRPPEFIKRSFDEGRALILLDGSDELAPAGLEKIIDFIKAIKKTYPATRMVTTANPEYLDGLVTLNFVPFALTAWDDNQRSEFLEKWGQLWTRYINVEAWAQNGPDAVDTLLLNRWLSTDALIRTPLELTLKTWGAYAGDLRGGRTIDDLEAHVRRLKPAEAPFEALELLALQICMAVEPVFDPRKAREWIKSFEPVETEQENEDGTPPRKKRGRKNKSAPSLGLIAKMADSGLLTQHRGNRMRFVHPVLSGYLAGKTLVNYKAEDILSQPPWSGKTLTLQYLAAYGDVTNLVNDLLGQADRPLERNLFIPARWLRDTPPQAAWRGQVLSRLATLMQQEGQPLSLRGQALTAFLLSGDPSTATLFRQLYSINSPELLQLCALGSGALKDIKAIENLSRLLAYPSPNVQRAACLALTAIGTTAALEEVASALLHGAEDLRRMAAEALADHPREGHAMLKEAVEMDDILVRRAALYGLGRVKRSWANEILAKMQTEEKEWIVRNAATDVIDKKKAANVHIPKRLPPPHESPWLIEYAGKLGMGISPEKPATEILLQALKSDYEAEQMAALPYLRMMPSEGVFGALYKVMYTNKPELREAVFQTIWEMAARGVPVPDPQQFGVG